MSKPIDERKRAIAALYPKSGDVLSVSEILSRLNLRYSMAEDLPDEINAVAAEALSLLEALLSKADVFDDEEDEEDEDEDAGHTCAGCDRENKAECLVEHVLDSMLVSFLGMPYQEIYDLLEALKRETDARIDRLRKQQQKERGEDTFMN
jgi:cation transport regulator ChaB